LAQFPDWNSRVAESDDDGGQVRRVMTSAGEMDAIEILKPKGCYVGRAI